ncbi:9718_t:CDS:2 [Ambispora gerdemannii]|uniref:9718_t:CDS:1 n=1 Tax=Ambispora gerdemannii TaxID=144530 RepID=A0A9N9GH15_9GLOM|nr:9718_t:CDS:2 [Ambispora gerdemannii]
MPVCTSCHQTKNDEAFFHKNKKWKTCQTCIEQRAAKKAKTKRKREEESSVAPTTEEETPRVALRSVALMELSDLVASELRELSSTPAPYNQDGSQTLAFNLRVSLNLTGVITGTENPKEVARWIVEEIERADEFNWTYNCMNTSMRHKDVAKFYYVCSQSMVAMKEYKEGSNRKRMERFPCQGKMQMKIDIPAGEAMLEIHHGLLHSRPVITTEISDECRKEIEENLNLPPIQLRSYLRTKGVLKNYTPKQIHTYWERVAAMKNPTLLAQYNAGLAPTLPGDYTIMTAAMNNYTGNIVSINPISTDVPMVPVKNQQKQIKFDHDEFVEYAAKMEHFSKRVRDQLERGNYLWLDTVKILTAGVIEMENDIEELERQRASERGTKPWTMHYK